MGAKVSKRRRLSLRSQLPVFSSHSVSLVLLALVCAMVIAACDSGAATPPAQGPTPLPADPVSVARLFLDDWTHGNYAEMYKLITPAGWVLYSPSAFTEIYKNAESTMSVGSEGKAYDLLEDQSFQQGTTYVVKYNMTFDSGSLGKFTDSNRTMRLVQ